MKLAVLLTLTALVPCAAHPLDEVGVGEPVPELKLHTLLGGDGRNTLGEYRGSPVLFAWYSTVGAGMNGAPDAVKLGEEYARHGLVVILVEIKNHDATYLRALQMNALPGASCPLLENQPLPFAYDNDTGPPPKVALVGIDGTLLYAGSYQKLRDVEKLLDQEAQRRVQGWGVAPAAKAARAAAFGASDLAGARAALAAANDGDAEVAAARQEIEGRFATWKRSVGFLRDAGEVQRAKELAAALVEATRGDAEWNAEAKELLGAFDGEALRGALDVEAKLDRLLKPLQKKKPAKGQARRFLSFAEEADEAGYPALAQRARSVAEAIEFAVEEL